MSIKSWSFFLFSLVFTVCAFSNAKAETKQTQSNLYKKIYKKKCQSCHSSKGTGNKALAKSLKIEDPALLDLTRPQAAGNTDEEWIRITAEGLNKMPAYKTKLKAEDIEGVIVYLRTFIPRPEAKEESPTKENKEKPASKKSSKPEKE